MMSFSFRRNTTRASKLKNKWKADKPLGADAGGSVAALTAEDIKTKSDGLRAGNKYLSLGCLTQLSNDFSLAGITYDETQIEQLGRKLWCATAQGNQTPPPPGIEVSTGASEAFWKDFAVSFPKAWPDGVGALPIGLRDAGVLPALGKFRLLALDEAVASFWKMVGRVAERKDQLKTAIAKLGGDPGGQSPETDT